MQVPQGKKPPLCTHLDRGMAIERSHSVDHEDERIQSSLKDGRTGVPRFVLHKSLPTQLRFVWPISATAYTYCTSYIEDALCTPAEHRRRRLKEVPARK